MGWFPFFMELEGKNGLIVGGGNVAVRKAEKLLPFGVSLTMIAPDFCKEARSLDGVQRIFRKFQPTDIEGMQFVIGATNEKQTNEEIYQLCKAHSVLVNVVDDKERCTFLFPALVQRGAFVAGFTTGGKSPLASSYIRKWVEESLPANFDEMIEFLGRYRQEIQEQCSSSVEREALLRKAFSLVIEKGRGLSSVETGEIWERRNEHDV